MTPGQGFPMFCNVWEIHRLWLSSCRWNGLGFVVIFIITQVAVIKVQRQWCANNKTKYLWRKTANEREDYCFVLINCPKYWSILTFRNFSLSYGAWECCIYVHVSAQRSELWLYHELSAISLYIYACTHKRIYMHMGTYVSWCTASHQTFKNTFSLLVNKRASCSRKFLQAGKYTAECTLSRKKPECFD